MGVIDKEKLGNFVKISKKSGKLTRYKYIGTLPKYLANDIDLFLDRQYVSHY